MGDPTDGDSSNPATKAAPPMDNDALADCLRKRRREDGCVMRGCLDGKGLKWVLRPAINLPKKRLLGLDIGIFVPQLPK